MTLTLADTERPTFSARLKTETAARHKQAEHSSFMADLMGGKLTVEAYRMLLTQYTYIYEALEEVAAGFRAQPNPITEPFVLKGLDRLASIKADLAELGGPIDDQPLSATADYAAAIRATASAPERFLAHHYLRYLGDLSGGQAVAALVARHYGVPTKALSMYRFETLPKPKVFKDSYRVLLDEAPLTDAQRDALIDEALTGFDHNTRVFAQLGKRLAP
ncbi:MULTISPECIES: biliverdin-producing heme oxygenase [Actinomycetes]|uniref:biliverdin-producing heme oxygenase n=1 Tax=Corynebacterium sp. TaxID=1720 RepID=UPI002A9090F2|nr:biliverdin-producing heme oxygenase [Corynebacterium sp.]MDY5786570.1 biliverdin-producing heme oxygenase [Corynebacterium sp.]